MFEYFHVEALAYLVYDVRTPSKPKNYKNYLRSNHNFVQLQLPDNKSRYVSNNTCIVSSTTQKYKVRDQRQLEVTEQKF